MSYSYGWEKLHSAIHSLASERPDQRDRLKSAVAGALIRINPTEDLTPAIRDDFERMMRMLTTVDGTNAGPIERAVDALDDPLLRQTVAQIIHFYDHMCREVGSL